MFEKFFQKRAETSLAVQVADLPPESIYCGGVDEKQSALESVLMLDEALADFDRRYGAFRMKHFALVNGQPVFVHPKSGDTGADRRAIESAWKELCDERDRIITARNAALRKYAAFSR